MGTETHQRVHPCGGPCLRTICYTLLLLCLASPVHAVKDWNRMDDALKGALGLHAGKLGGVGVAYKYPPVWWLYCQVAGGIWHTSSNERHNVGFSLQYLLRQDTTKRIYLAAGAGYFYHKEIGDDGSENVDDHWNVGFGFGLELLWQDRLSLQIEGDFTHEGDSDNIIFLPQLGIFYYF